MTSLPVVHAAAIDDRAEETRWLIEGLWVDEGVGIIGGQPKCCKSFMALDMAVAIASGTPCLRRYPVCSQGTVLLFAGEDSLSVVKRRLMGICRAAKCSLETIDIKVITVPVLRLDDEYQQQALMETIKEVKPKLIILDPFIRMHRIDENNSGEVAALLAYLRAINRTFKVSVALVHHASKRGNIRAGQTLRGSSEFHAWGDSNLYLQRGRDERLTLTAEHRSESSKAGIALELWESGEILALREIADLQPPALSPDEKIHQILSEADSPLTLDKIRKLSKLRRNTVCEIVRNLVAEKRATKEAQGYRIAN